MEEHKLRELLSCMSLTEKIGQLLQVGGNYLEEEGVITGPENIQGFTQKEIDMAGTVLGSVGAAKLKKIQKEYMVKQPHHIPLIFMADIINGYRTIFPIPLAQGCSFDVELVRQVAEIAAKESEAAGLHITFSPMVDLVNDARWGRVMESAGEDTYLNRQFAKAMVEGYQGKKDADGRVDLTRKGKIGACVKHFAAYGAPLAGREYNTVELSERTLKDDYFPSYQEAVDAGVCMAMTSFNVVNHVPASGNKWLLRDVLRGDMGFKGVLISDWTAVEELVNHGVAEDKKRAAELAIKAGVDIDMCSTCYCRNLEMLIKEGKIEEALLDEAVMRVLKLKNDLGLFENPYKGADETKEKEVILCLEHRKAARKAAADTFVLLKNEGVLPLKKEGKKIAFIGPHVANREIYGAWSMFGRSEETISISDALSQRKIDAVQVKVSAISDNNTEPELQNVRPKRQKEEYVGKEQLEEAVKAAEEADVVVMALGEHRLWSGEAASRADITVPYCQMELFRQVQKANANVVVVLFTGRPLDIREISEKAKAVLVVWQPGSEGGNAILDVLYGEVNPSAKLSMCFPYCVGQLPLSYHEFHTGRPYTLGDTDKYKSKYLDIPNKPLYPFGFGLSYTEFSVSPIKLSSDRLTKKGSITASVAVKNIGEMAGYEVIQLYITDCYASVARRVRELKGFKKIKLEPKEEKEVVFTITDELLRFTNIDMEYTCEEGRFIVAVGNSSETENTAEFLLY